MNIPNAITAGRFVLAFVFFGVLSWYFAIERSSSPEGGTTPLWILDLALVIFVLAALTDWLDGFVARRMGTTTTLGRIADPLVDKIIVGGAFVYFLPLAERTFVKPWMVVLILSREFLVTGIRSYAESQGQAFGALIWGKAKMWVQCATIITILVYLGHYEGEAWASNVTQLAVYGTVIATVASCFPYLRKAAAKAQS